MTNYFWFFYLCPKTHNMIRIKEKRKPSKHTRTARGTWVVNEFYEGKWTIPCFPEITLGRLQQFEYIGKIPLSRLFALGSNWTQEGKDVV